MDKIIMDFTSLSRLAHQKKLSANTEKYIYLLWLGLTSSEISSAYYNPATRTVDISDSTIFVKEDKIAECLSSGGGSPLDKKSISDAQAELENAGISPEIIYKSGFFNMRYEQSVLGQPEDLVRIKEMGRHIKDSAEKLEKEYTSQEQRFNTVNKKECTKTEFVFSCTLFYSLFLKTSTGVIFPKNPGAYTSEYIPLIVFSRCSA